MAGRIIDFARMTSERVKLQGCVTDFQELNSDVLIVDNPPRPNPVGQEILGLFRSPTARKAVIADMELLSSFETAKLRIPSFLEAGPRAELRHDPRRVRAAIVTTGGLAPGLHDVIHSIVKRHVHTYSLDQDFGDVLGIYDGFKGLCRLADYHVRLMPKITEEWLDHGGSKLGNVRYYHEGQKDDAGIASMVKVISTNLRNNNIDIVYVIGGDGSLKVAHELAKANPQRSIVGVPKTMDNDILWVWQSFGFNTAVEQATRVMNVLRSEAESTRRICLIELFGAESGFVAANAALASGHIDLVLIPEVFNQLDVDSVQAYLDNAIKHIEKRVQSEPHNPHAVVVVAEGVANALQEKAATLNGVAVTKDFIHQLAALIEARVYDAHGQPMTAFINQPRHFIRAVPANAHDQIYCERLGALAVDNALAGYTDFMISQWLAEFVLVPLELVGAGKKCIPINGMFWKQVVSTTGQPLSPAEQPKQEAVQPQSG
jgi:6-phosphofructokinase 1